MSDEPQDERVELEQLRTAMETLPVIDQAKGVLMAAYSLTPEDAWKILVSVSQHSNVKLHAVAEDIVANAPDGDVQGSFPKMIEIALEELKTQ